jgi:plastocyanin
MRLRTLALAALCAALLAACSGSSDPIQPTPAPVRTATTASESPAAPTATSTPTSAPSPSPTATAEPVTPTATATVANTPAPTAGGGTAPLPTTVSQPPTATPTPASSNPMSATIGASSARNVWSPSRVTVAVGGTVEWKWVDAPAQHNVAGENFSLGPTDITDTELGVKFTFTAAGTYTFVCQIHPDMKGTVTVQ